MGVNLGLDEERVSAWLSANVSDVVAPFTFSLIAGGRSNLTFEVVDGRGERFVLRRPPLGHVLATAHDMAREHRLISAVGTTSVPVPRALGLCVDTNVTGAPFYVMSFVDGVVLDGPEKATLLPVPRRRSAAFDLIDVLAELHLLDVDAIGLGDLAKRTGYVERQLRRWSKQWQDSKTRELPAIEEVEARLRSEMPVQQAVSVAHGDYRFGNCLTDPDAGRIAAVLDWELCTLGDPLADVGYLRVYWADPAEDGRPAGGRHNDPTPAGGFPSYDELVERYARRTGFDLSGIEYYVAFSSWRLAVISEGVYARYLHGAMADDGVDLDVFRQGTEELAERALAAARRLGRAG
jgi:aminoglycoside phosphotransferase (APT) family kinase protein